MTYPAVSRKSAEAIASRIREAVAEDSNPLAAVIEAGEKQVENRHGGDYDRTGIERFSETARSKHLAGVDDMGLHNLRVETQTRLEATLAGPLHSQLSSLPVACLQDPDFWRYLALFPFRWYLLAREPELQPQDYGGETTVTLANGKPAIQGTSMKYQVMLRTYLWGKCAFDDADPLAEGGDCHRRSDVISKLKDKDSSIALSEIDVWHSHMVRVQMGQLGMIPAAFIDTITNPDCSTTNEARELEKLVTRMKHNAVLDMYDYESALALVREQLPMARAKAAAKSKPDAAAKGKA